MKRVLTPLALAVSGFFFAGFASAQTAVPSFSFIGSGCPADEDSVDYHWEGSTLVINFASLTASKGPGVSLLESRKNCSLTMDLRVPKGLKYTLVSYSATGYESLGEGDTRNLNVSSFFQGSADQSSFVSEAEGPKEDEFRATGVASSQELLWSPCGAQRAQTINTAVRVNGKDRQAPAYAMVESLRLRFRLGLCLPVNNEPSRPDDQVSIDPAAD